MPEHALAAAWVAFSGHTVTVTVSGFSVTVTVVGGLQQHFPSARAMLESVDKHKIQLESFITNDYR